LACSIVTSVVRVFRVPVKTVWLPHRISGDGHVKFISLGNTTAGKTRVSPNALVCLPRGFAAHSGQGRSAQTPVTPYTG
jgi:hypothetical protein